MDNEPDREIPEIETVVGEVNLDVGDGGTRFRVIDHQGKYSHGATIKVDGSHFGNCGYELNIMTDAKSLRALGEMFTKAAEHGYSGEYCYAAHVYDPKDYHYVSAGSSDQNANEEAQTGEGEISVGEEDFG